MKCDIGDIVTCIPKQTDVKSINNKTDELNSIARAVLNEYMSKSNLSLSDIAKTTSLSLNTVKSFVNGNNISAASHAKFLKPEQNTTYPKDDKEGADVWVIG